MIITERVLPRVLALLLLGGTIFSAIWLISPPPTSQVSAPATEFSAERAMQHLEIIGREPHPMGEFTGRFAVRDYILEEIRAPGLRSQIQATVGVRLVEPGLVLAGAVENILLRLPGTDPAGAILLVAHYDATPGGPGAGDNGSGVVTLLELLRAMMSIPPIRHDVIFYFPDGHEPGIIGTYAFVAQHP